MIISEPNGEAKTVRKKMAKRSATSYAVEFFIKIGITVVIAVVLCIFIIGIHVNHGNSSYPMIKDGDLVITYKIGSLASGEEIIYRSGDTVKVGRIVAVGGEVIDITETGITVNGLGISENVVYPTTAGGATIEFPYTVPEGTVFVLNDFRSDINDSRTTGAVPLSQCEGKVILVLRRRGI